MSYGVYGPVSGRTVNAQLKIMIADITLKNPASFESIPIPAGFDGVTITAHLRSTASVNGDGLYVLFNEDTTAGNYRAQESYAVDSAVGAAGNNAPFFGNVPGATALANAYGQAEITITNLRSDYALKTAISVTPFPQTTSQHALNTVTVNWKSTRPITTITLRTDNHPTDLFAAESRVQIFGLGTFAVALAR